MSENAFIIWDEDGHGHPEPIGTKRIVHKSFRLIDAQQDFSLFEHKLLAAAISVINPKNPYRDRDGYIYVALEHEQIAHLLGITKSYVARVIDKAADAYCTKPLTLPPKKENTPWESYCIAYDSQGRNEWGLFHIRFNRQIDDELVWG